MRRFELVYKRKEQGSKGTYGVDIYANSLEEAEEVVKSFPNYITNLCYGFKITGEVVDNIVFLENADLIEMGLLDQIDNSAEYNYDFLFMLHQIDYLSDSEKEYVKGCILEHELYELMKFYK